MTDTTAGVQSVDQTVRKDRVLEAAAQLFSERRFDEVSMEEIAQQAEVGKGTLYTYFANKEELYFAVVFDGIARLNESLREGAIDPSAPEERLRQMVHRIVSFFSQNRFFFRLMSIEDNRTEGGKGDSRRHWQEERRAQMEAIETVLRNGQKTGVFRIAHPTVEAHILRDMVRTVMVNTRDLDLTVDEIVDIILCASSWVEFALLDVTFRV